MRNFLLILTSAFLIWFGYTQIKKSKEVVIDPAAASQKEALKRYPELGNKESAFNQNFRQLVEEKKKTSPEIFKSPDWPMQLAAETGNKLGVEPVRDDQEKKFDPRAFPTNHTLAPTTKPGR